MTQKRILVVDDSSDIRMLVSRVLERAQYAVKTASNGAEALAVLLADCDFDGIISDIDMPIMDGLELISAISAHAHLAEIPFLILSGEVREDKLARAKACGAKGWVVKSVSPTNLLSAVERLLAPI